jgi:hypothetical protein
MNKVQTYLFLDELKRFLKSQGKYIDKTLIENKVSEFEEKHFPKDKYVQKDLFEK